MGVYHGKRGSGVSVEANVISGPVTTLGLTQTGDGRLKLIASEGVAKKLPILTIGNTQTPRGLRPGPGRIHGQVVPRSAHPPCALSVGHNARAFEKVGSLMGIRYAKV